MNQVTNCTNKSDLHSGEKTTLTIQRVFDILRTELKKESSETEATTKFKEDLTFFENEYSGIQEICSAYKEAYREFNDKMIDKAKEQWENIVSWSEGKVGTNVETAIKELRQGPYYAEGINNLKKIKDDIEEELFSLKNCHEYFEKLSNRAIEEFEKTKIYEKTIKDYFTDLTKLHEEAKKYKDAEKYRSLFVIRLEFEDIREKTLTPKDSGTLIDPEKLKEDLANGLRKIIAFKHERFLWHKDFLENQKALLQKQKDFEKAKENYEEHIKNIRDRLIREAEDIQLATGSTQPETPAAPLGAGGPKPATGAAPTEAGNTANKSQKTTSKK